MPGKLPLDGSGYVGEVNRNTSDEIPPIIGDYRGALMPELSQSELRTVIMWGRHYRNSFHAEDYEGIQAHNRFLNRLKDMQKKT